MSRSHQKLSTHVQPDLHNLVPVASMPQNGASGYGVGRGIAPGDAATQTVYKGDDGPSGRIPRIEHRQLEIAVSIREFQQIGQNIQE